MRKTSLVLLGAALIGSAATGQRPYDPQAQLARALAGRIAGPALPCIDLRRVTRTEVIGGVGIVYRINGRVFLNRPRTGLAWLERDSILVTRPVVSQLCRNEPVQLIDRTGGVQRGFVTLGEFVPYMRRRES